MKLNIKSHDIIFLLIFTKSYSLKIKHKPLVRLLHLFHKLYIIIDIYIYIYRTHNPNIVYLFCFFFHNYGEGNKDLSNQHYKHILYKMYAVIF